MASGPEQEVTHDAADACSLSSFVSETSQDSDNSENPLMQSFSLKKHLQDDTSSIIKSSPLTGDSPVIPIQLFDGDLSPRRTLRLHYEPEGDSGRKLMESDCQSGEASSQPLVTAITSAADDDNKVDNDVNSGDQGGSTTKDSFSQSTASTQHAWDSFPQREEEAEIIMDTTAKLCNKLSATSSYSDNTECAFLSVGLQTGMEERMDSPGLTFDGFQASRQKDNTDYNIEHGGNTPQNANQDSYDLEMKTSTKGSSLIANRKQDPGKDIGDANGNNCGNKSTTSRHESGDKKSSSSGTGSSFGGSIRDVVHTNSGHSRIHGSSTFRNSCHENTYMETSPSTLSPKGHTQNTIRSHLQTEENVETSLSLDSSPKSETQKTLGKDRNVCTLTKNSCFHVKQSVKKFKVPYSTNQIESVPSDAVQSSIAMEREGVENEQCLINSGAAAIQKKNTQENSRVRSSEPLGKNEENATVSPVDGNMNGDAREKNTLKCGETLTKITESVGYSHVTGTMKDSIREKNNAKGSEPNKKNEEPVDSQINWETTDASQKGTYTLCNKGSDLHRRCVLQETESEMNPEVYSCTQAARHIQSTGTGENDGVATRNSDSFGKATETTPFHDCLRTEGLVHQHGDATRKSSQQGRERIDYTDNGYDRDDESDVTIPPHSVYTEEKPSFSQGCLNEGAKRNSWKSQNIVDTAKDIDYLLSKDLNQANESLIMERISHVYGKRSVDALEKTAKAFVIQCLEKAVLLINKRQQEEKSILAMKVKRGKMTQEEKSDTKKRLQNLSERCVNLRNLFHDHQKWKLRVSASVAQQKSSQGSVIDVTQQESPTAHIESAKSTARKDTIQFYTVRNCTLQKNGDLSVAHRNDTSRDFAVSSSKVALGKSRAVITITDNEENMDSGGEVMQERVDDDQMSQSILLPRSLRKQQTNTSLSQASNIYPNVTSPNLHRETIILKSVLETQNLHSNRESQQTSEISTTIHKPDLNRFSITAVLPKSQNTQDIKQRPKIVTSTDSPGQLNESSDTNARTQDPANFHDELMDTGSQSTIPVQDCDKADHLVASPQQDVSEDVTIVPSVSTQHCISERIQHLGKNDVEQNRSAPFYHNDVLMSQTPELLSQMAHDIELPSQSLHTVSASSKMSHDRDDSRPNYNRPEIVDDPTTKGSGDENVPSEMSVSTTRREKNDIRISNIKDQSSGKGNGIKTTSTNTFKPRNVQSPTCSTFSRKRLRSFFSSSGRNSEEIHSLQNDNDVDMPKCKSQKMDSMLGNKRQNLPSSIAQPDQSNSSDVSREHMPSCSLLKLNINATPMSGCTELLAVETANATTEVLPDIGINTRSSDCVEINVVAEETKGNASEQQRQTRTLSISSASQYVTADKQTVTVNVAIPSGQVVTAPVSLPQSKSAEQRISHATPSFSQNIGSKQAMSTFNQPAPKQAPLKLLNMNSRKQSQKFTVEPLQAKETRIFSPESQQSRVSFLNLTRRPVSRFTTPRRPASPSPSAATSMTDVFPVSSKEIMRRMAKEAITNQKDSISGQTEHSSKKKEVRNKQLGPIPSEETCTARPAVSSGDTDHRERSTGLEDRQLRNGRVTDNIEDVCCSDVASIGSGATNVGTQTLLIRQKGVRNLYPGATVVTEKVSLSENLGLHTLASANGRKPKLPNYSDLFTSGVVQPGMFSLRFSWKGGEKRGTILADGRIEDSAGLTFTNPVSWYKAVTAMSSTTKIIAYSKIFYKGRSLAAVCEHFKVSELHTHSDAVAPPSSNNTATTRPSATTSACPPRKAPPPPAPLERPRARVPQEPSYGSCNDKNQEKNPPNSAGGCCRRKPDDNARGSREQPLARSVSLPVPNRAANSVTSFPCNARVLTSLRRLKLIKDEEIVPHTSDCEFSSFWGVDFAKITMSPAFWATVDDWD